MLFIICGHGAGDSGAVGNGYTEAERVRTLAKRIKELGGANVEIGDMSKNWYKSGLVNNTNIPRGAVVLELHMDSGAASARGAHVIIDADFDADDYDKALAAFICDMFPGRSQSIVKRNDLANPNRAQAAGINYRLLECGFISNAGDVQTFNSRMDEIAAGILGAFGIMTAASGWQKDDKGWQYKNADGSYAKGWKKIAEEWYYFDENGYALHDCWKMIAGHWYYFKSGCQMAKGWRLIGEYWYYLNPVSKAEHPEGGMLDGWIYVGKNWYYLNRKEDDGSHGAMAKGFRIINGHTYYFAEKSKSGSPEGSMAVGWCKVGEDYYYFNKTYNCQSIGSMLKSHWIEENGKKYYLKEDGKMAQNETLILSGKEYVFSASGALI